jgi:hypothetical protein
MTNARDVALTFRAAGIEGPQAVTFATGNKGLGYVLRARPNSMKAPSGKYSSIRIPGWHAVGAFRYFDVSTLRVIQVGLIRHFADPYIDDTGPVEEVRYKALPFQYGIPGRSRGNPEASLVRAYVSWLGDPDRFDHPYIQADGLYADLFDRRKWRLFEAKARTTRHHLRTAVGQLLDYRRFFKRPPSIGVLLSERPNRSVLDYLNTCNVTVVWRTPSGRFSDTRDGEWTRLRRLRKVGT